MLSLIREINKKINNEVRSMREEIKEKFREVEKEMKDNHKKWDYELKKIKENLERDKKQANEKAAKDFTSLEKKYEEIINGKDRRGEVEGEKGWEVKCQDNERHIASLWEEIDEVRIRWRDTVEDLREETKKILIDSGEKMERRLQQEIKKIEEVVTGKNVMRNREGDRGKTSSMVIAGRTGESDEWNHLRENSQETMDSSVIKEIIPPKFEDRPEENPKRFVKQFEEFARLKRIPEDLKKMWFRRCIGEKVNIWYEAIGRNADDFQTLKQSFLRRYWSSERQIEIIRKFYTPGGYKDGGLTKEQHLLKAFNENRFLDHPLPERNAASEKRE